jgi:lysophospholipase L1-like esterase
VAMNAESRQEKRWMPSWAALCIVGLTLGAAGFARCGASAPAPAPAPAPEPGVALVAPEAEPQAEPAPEPASAPSAVAEPAAVPAPRQIYRVAAIGDSLTDERSSGGKFLKYLRQRCPESRFDNFGKGADMVNQMRRRFGRDVLPAAAMYRYTHFIVFGGVNDLYSDLTAGRTPEKIGRDLSAMYAGARERGMKVVALTVAPWGGFRKYYNASRGQATRTVNDWMKQQLAEGSIDHVVDAYALLSCENSEELCGDYALPYKDGLHFGPKGHERLGEALFEQVFKDCR